ncbi:MAG: CRISPR-associated protein Cas4 [Candidatus Bathyarchaeota archaeon]|nr:CRISPR-associated protein Cas4 [Candidatus Bathyarchaeota archaeon]
MDQTRLEKQIPETKEITIRGYDEKCRPEADLSGNKIGVHFLANYCPTDRYLYISKKRTEITIEKTWESLKGKIFEEVYFEVYKRAKDFISGKQITELHFDDWIKNTVEEITAGKKEKVRERRDSLCNKPKTGKVKEFYRQIEVLSRFELQMFSSHLQFISCKRKSMNLETIFQTVFDFVFEHSIDGTKLGLENSITPDFIYVRRIIGDIKTGKWEEFYRVMIAAYAMTYEASENTDMNCGMVLNPNFFTTRSTPLYLNSDIFVVNDIHRKAFLILRNKKLQILKLNEMPALPSDKSSCICCGYFSFCWGKN